MKNVESTFEIYLSKRFQKHKCHYSCSLYQYINNPDIQVGMNGMLSYMKNFLVKGNYN